MNRATSVPGFQRPAFVLGAKKDFDALLKQFPELAFVDALVIDINGTLRGKRLPASDAGRLFESGMQIPRTVYLMDPRGEMTNPFGRGFGDGDPDGTAWPIPGTLVPVWDERLMRAQMLMTLRDEAGLADPAEPRAVLERVVERFGEWNLTPVCALELEFYLIDCERAPDGAPLPPRDPRTGRREAGHSVYDIDDLDRYRAFMTALNEAARVQGVPLSAASSEYAPGQLEVNLKHQADALRAADHAIFLKQIVKASARHAGFDATFMAKPYPERSGSGLHIHVSVVDKNGANVFNNESAEGSPLLRHAVGGMQALMPESMAFFAPSVNSYRRFQPDMFAPVNRHWGVNNRSAGLRVPVGPGEARRIEHRVAGADANPYLALACVLAGLHFGLANKIDPGAPAIDNVSRDPDLALAFSIEDALAKLGEARALPSYLGDETVSLYRESKRLELARFRKIMSAAEYEWYL
jgi:glutamine synthetase